MPGDQTPFPPAKIKETFAEPTVTFTEHAEQSYESGKTVQLSTKYEGGNRDAYSSPWWVWIKNPF